MEEKLGVGQPRFLKKGDIIDIVAPGFACSIEELEKSLEYLTNLGLEPRVPSPIFSNDVICSNTDENRFEFLKTALMAKDSAAIWCLRGGYGSLRLLPMLNKLKKPSHKKLLIGYSDITSLQHFLLDKWGWASIHGPMLERAGLGKLIKKDQKVLEDLLFGKAAKIEFSGLRPLNPAAAKSKTKIHGTLSGGNLATLASAVGTSFAASGRGKVIFIEEIGERGHQVDRLLTQLEFSGFFKGAKAIIFGEFVGGAEPSSGKLKWKPVIRRFAENIKVPVFDGVPMGHGKRQVALPFGEKATLIKSSKLRFSFESQVSWKG